MPIHIDLFCEDHAHEACARSLVAIAAGHESVEVSLRVASATCGIPRLKRELRAYQEIVQRSAGSPDLLLVLIDANRVGPAARRTEIIDAIETGVFPMVVIGTPDPCVERWLLADPVSFAAHIGVQPDTGPTKDRARWKTRLVDALVSANEIVTQGGAEFSDEIFGSMDLYRAGRSVPTLGAFVDELRATLRRLAASA